MSHFAAMVIGDVDHNLAPFHEFECTGNDDEFIQEVDQTEELRADYERYKDNPNYPTISAFAADYYGLKKVEFGDKPDTDDDHKYGYHTVDEAGELVKAINRTNPDKKWDYYTVGGRWSGFLLGKDGQRHDSLKKSEIDIDGMRNEASKRAEEQYDLAMAGVEGSWVSWKETLAKLPGDFPGDLDEVRKSYHNQPQVLKINENLGRDAIFFDRDALLVGREKYIQAARDRAISTLAIVTDRKWAERGSMGWFGIVSDETDADEWNERIGKFLDALPEDALISIVDCHI